MKHKDCAGAAKKDLLCHKNCADLYPVGSYVSAIGCNRHDFGLHFCQLQVFAILILSKLVPKFFYKKRFAEK